MQSTNHVFLAELLNANDSVYLPVNAGITLFCYLALLLLPIHFLMFKYFVLCTYFGLWTLYRKKKRGTSHDDSKSTKS